MTETQYLDLKQVITEAIQSAWGNDCQIAFGRPLTAFSALPRALVGLARAVERRSTGVHTITNSWSFEIIGAFATPTTEIEPFQMSKIQLLVNQLEPEFETSTEIEVRDGFGEYGFLPEVSSIECVEPEDEDQFVMVKLTLRVQTEVFV